MRVRTTVRTWVAAVLGAAVFFVPPAMAGSVAADPTPSPTPSPWPSGPVPCRTGPIPPSPPPNTPPSAPGTPEVTAVFMNLAQLRWAPATDDDGIACYSVRELKDDGTSALVATFQPAVTEGSVNLPWPPYGVPSETHHLYVVATDTKGAVGPASGTVAVTIYNDIVSPSPSVSPSPTCRVEATSTTWGGGMTTNIAITNTGSATVRDWRLTFAFPDPGQQVTAGWSATWSQTGSAVTASAMSWNGDIAPGKTLWIGFNGTHTGANPTPAVFRLNGAACA